MDPATVWAVGNLVIISAGIRLLLTEKRNPERTYVVRVAKGPIEKHGGLDVIPLMDHAGTEVYLQKDAGLNDVYYYGYESVTVRYFHGHPRYFDSVLDELGDVEGTAEWISVLLDLDRVGA